VRLSPDGSRVAVYMTDVGLDLWIWDLARKTLTRLTSEPGLDSFPVWTRDGRRIIYSSSRGDGILNLFWQAADGTGLAERLAESPHTQRPTGITPDGTQVVFEQETSTMGTDLMLLTLTPTRRITPLLATRFNERRGVVSPDGRWLAYESDSSGRSEIYVRPFPVVGAGQSQVSTAGGMQPLWARTGRELFYVAPDGSVLTVPVAPRGDAWNAGTPRKVVANRYRTGPSSNGRNYDTAPDGQRFLMIKRAGDSAAASPTIVVVQHWDEELRARVPTK
jgi:serine/threonine-protein kinase